MTIGAHGKVDAGAAATTSVTPSFASTGGSGATLIVDVQWYGAAISISSVTDNKSNTYTQQGSTVTFSGDTALQMARFVCERFTGGSGHVITATLGGSASVALFYAEHLGCITSGTIVDQAPAGLSDAHSNATPYVSNTTGATAQATEVVYTCSVTYSASGTEVHSYNNGYTLLDELTNAANWTAASGYKDLSAAGTQQSSLSATGSGATGALTFLTTLKLAGGGGGSPAVLQQQKRAQEFGGDTAPRRLAFRFPGAVSAAVIQVLPSRRANVAFDEQDDPQRRRRFPFVDNPPSAFLGVFASGGYGDEAEKAPRRLAFIFPVAAASSAPPGMAAETDASLALAASHIAAPGISLETGSSLAQAAQHVAVPGVATEADAAFALVAQRIAPPGIATETDSATGGASPPGASTETDTAFALAASHVAPPGIATEADTALAVSAQHVAGPGVSAETDAVLARTVAHVAGPGISIELDTALSPAGATPGISIEIDTAFALTSAHVAPPGISLETDTTFVLAAGHVAAPGVATEAGAAFARTTQHVAPPSVSLETDTALGSAGLVPGIASETDSALALSSQHRAIPGLATETETAFSRTATHVAAPGLSVEIDSALALGRSAAPGVSVETNAAFALAAQHVSSPEIGVEIDGALGLVVSHVASPGIALELDSVLAQIFALAKTIRVGVALLRKRTGIAQTKALMMDSNVAFLTTPKDPRTEEDFNWDVRPLLKSGDSVATVTKIFVQRGDSSLSILSVPAIDGSGGIVSARLGGGRRGMRYRVTIYFATTTGEKLDFSLEFDCV